MGWRRPSLESAVVQCQRRRAGKTQVRVHVVPRRVSGCTTPERDAGNWRGRGRHSRYLRARQKWAAGAVAAR